MSIPNKHHNQDSRVKGYFRYAYPAKADYKQRPMSITVVAVRQSLSLQAWNPLPATRRPLLPLEALLPKCWTLLRYPVPILMPLLPINSLSVPGPEPESGWLGASSGFFQLNNLLCHIDLVTSVPFFQVHEPMGFTT